MYWDVLRQAYERAAAVAVIYGGGRVVVVHQGERLDDKALGLPDGGA